MFLVTTSMVEAASAEQAKLLEKQKVIQQANVQASGFVVSEVETIDHMDWHIAKVVGVCDIAVGMRCVMLETKVSHEVCRQCLLLCQTLEYEEIH